MQTIERRRGRRRAMAEINVVPYIDVMLVLLVIFMVTAPLMTQGVKVDLPQAVADMQNTDPKLPIIIHIDAQNAIYVDAGDSKLLPVDQQLLYDHLKGVLAQTPGTPVMVRADHTVNYGRVMEVMVAAQAAGVPSVGLVTRPPDQSVAQP